MPTATPINYRSPMTLLPSLSPIPSLLLTVLLGSLSKVLPAPKSFPQGFLRNNQNVVLYPAAQASLIPDSTPVSEISRSEKPHGPHISSSNLSVEKHRQVILSPPRQMAQMLRAGPTNCMSAPHPRGSRRLYILELVFCEVRCTLWLLLPQQKGKIGCPYRARWDPLQSQASFPANYFLLINMFNK